MTVDLVQIREMSKKKEDENWDFRLFLKGECDLDSDQIDQQVFAATRRAWAGNETTLLVGGESMPDPRADDSFQRFMHDAKFRKLVDSLVAPTP